MKITTMKRVLLVLGLMGIGWSLSAEQHITYTADDVTIFRNPERGFTEELGGETMLTNSNNHVVLAEADWYFDEEDSHYADRQYQSLVMLMYYLGTYKSTDLSEAVLQGFDEDMQKLRDEGFKCVLRFAYDWTSKEDADLTHVQRHITQLKPHLASNKDVIYVLETGFVGEWGEWYYTSHFGNKSQHLNANRRAVLTAMLDACPADRFLLVRYPLIKTEYLGDENALDSIQAFSGTNRARMGHHNDAFLSDYGNDGTYGRDGDGPEDDPVLRAYIARETLYVPNGGETNVEDKNLAKEVAKYDTTMAELKRYHWSFCGSSYSTKVTDRWRTNGAFDEMNRKLGYRYQLVDADLPETLEAGAEAPVRLQIRNVGFAPIYNERKVYLVLKGNQQSVFSIQMKTDPRRWLPNGVVTTIEDTLSIPASVANGTYSLYLYMPDMAPTIANDPRYAVRFANEDVWDAASGMNSLNASVTVSGGTDLVPAQKTGERPTKRLENGVLLIERNGVRYTAQGLRL